MAPCKATHSIERDLSMYLLHKDRPRRYETLKRSRAVAFGTVSDTIVEASDLVNKAIKLHVSGGLEYRSDIGSRRDLKRQKDAAAGQE